MNLRKALSIVLGIASAALVICAVWFHQDWGWLKFSLTALVVALVAIFLAAPQDSVKRP